MKKVEIESQRYVLDDAFKVEEAILRFERFDGQMSRSIRRLTLERGNSVAMVIYNLDTQKLLLLNQFRYATYRDGPGWMTEILAGMIDPGESPEAAIRREAHEETGLDVKKVEYIASFYPSPGGCSEQIYLYYVEISGDSARYLQVGGLAAEAENIMMLELSLEEALEQIRNGEIRDGKTILGIYWLESRFLKNK